MMRPEKVSRIDNATEPEYIEDLLRSALLVARSERRRFCAYLIEMALEQSRRPEPAVASLHVPAASIAKSDRSYAAAVKRAAQALMREIDL